MARSKRLRECEITSLRQDPRSNSTESEFDTESDSEPSSEPDSQSQSQIQEQANVGYDEIVEIVGNLYIAFLLMLYIVNCFISLLSWYIYFFIQMSKVM